jgi:hypothetical protein
MRSSIVSSMVVAGLLSTSAGQIAIAVPVSTAPFPATASPQRSLIEPVYYYRGHYYPYRHYGHYYRYHYQRSYYLHRSYRSSHWYYY